jgi:hypothetical protein
MVLFPLNTNNMHWTLVAVKFPTQLKEICQGISAVQQGTSVEDLMTGMDDFFEDDIGFIAFFDPLHEDIVTAQQREKLIIAIKR